MRALKTTLTRSRGVRDLQAVALLLGCLGATSAGCRRKVAAQVATTPRKHLALSITSRSGALGAAPSLVSLVAQQELIRANLHPGPGAPARTLSLLLAPEKAGATRVSVHLLGTPQRSHVRWPRCCGREQVATLRSRIRALLTTETGLAPAPSSPLWPGSHITRDQLNDALAAGIHWLIGQALKADAFALSDYQQIFLILRESARDPALRRLGETIGVRLARRYVLKVPRPMATDDLGKLFDHAAGFYFLLRFGVSTSPQYQQALRLAFKHATPSRLLRKNRRVSAARRILDDLVDFYFPYKLGLTMPVDYTALVAHARRFPLTFGPHETTASLEDRTYLATHILYVLSEFNQSQLHPAEVAHVIRFLEQASDAFLKANDVETLGEFADALKITGRSYGCPLLRRLVGVLMRAQNPDGSWGDPKDTDAYRRYHTTWTAFNGLLEYRFRRRGMPDPALRRAWRTAREKPIPTGTTPSPRPRIPPLRPPVGEYDGQP